MSEFLSLYITAPSRDVAKTIGRTRVEKRRGAYVDIIRDASIYRGRQGRGGDEVVLIAKSCAAPPGAPTPSRSYATLNFLLERSQKKGRKTAALSPV